MESKKILNGVYHPVNERLRCNTTLSEFKHHSLPGLNLIAKEHVAPNTFETISKLYCEPFINAKKPLPCLFHKPALTLCNEDLALKLVQEKYFWKRRKKQILELIHRKYKGKFSIDPKKLKKASQPTKLPYGIVRLADHLSKNPDKHFKGFYNWYFDNALTPVKSGEEQYLLHTGGEQLDHLFISSIIPDIDSPSISTVCPKYSVPMEQDYPIFHIFASGTNGRIGIRQRNSCTFFIFEENCDIGDIVNTSFSIRCGNYPFVSSDIGKRKICTVDGNRQMKLWSISQQSCLSEASLPESDSYLSDRFARVKFSEDYKLITAIDRRNIYCFDTRMTLTHPSTQWSCTEYVEICEDISLIVPSIINDHYCYIGTNHCCLSLDSRAGFVQKWTHMLPQTPAVGHALMVDGESDCTKETLIICSQSSNDIVAVCNKKSSNFSSTCLPFSLPNRTDTLREARANGVLYHPHLQNKFDFSVLGLASCDLSGCSTLFSLISTGDIFQQKLESKEYCLQSERSNRLTKKYLSYLEKWENDFIKTLSSHKKPHEVITHRVDMNDLFSKLDQVEVPEWKTKTANVKEIRKFTKKKLESYSDFLAPYLVNNYGILDDSDWEDQENNITDLSSKSFDKVHNWLHTGVSEFSEARIADDSLSNDVNSDSDEDSMTDNVSILSIESSEDEL